MKRPENDVCVSYLGRCEPIARGNKRTLLIAWCSWWITTHNLIWNEWNGTCNDFLINLLFVLKNGRKARENLNFFLKRFVKFECDPADVEVGDGLTVSTAARFPFVSLAERPWVHVSLRRQVPLRVTPDILLLPMHTQRRRRRERETRTVDIRSDDDGGVSSRTWKPIIK